MATQISLVPAVPALVAGITPLHTYGLFDVARRLGWDRSPSGRERTVRTVARDLDLLIAGRGFPKPLPHSHGGKLVDAVGPRSRWVRAAVDAWLDGTLPPGAAARVDAIDAARFADTLDARAEGIAA